MTPKPESETDPWAKVRALRPNPYNHENYYVASEVDAAIAAEAAQHQQEIAAKDAMIAQLEENIARQAGYMLAADARLAAVEAERDHARKCEANHMMADHERIEALKVERDRLKAAFLELHATVKGECPSLLDPDRGGSDVLWALCAAALTPQGQSTDGETR